MIPAGRYGYQRWAAVAALWLGVAALVVAWFLLLAARWVIRTVGPRSLVLAGVTADRIAVLDLVMDGSSAAEDLDRPGVVVGEVVSVRYEDSKETVRS